MPMIRVDAPCHTPGCQAMLHRLVSSEQDARWVERDGICDRCYREQQDARDGGEE